MPGYTLILPSHWRRLLIVCLVCVCLFGLLLYCMQVTVALGQTTDTPNHLTLGMATALAPATVPLTSISHELYLPLVTTQAVPKQRIALVDDVTVLVLQDDPPRLLITAYGTANADGWRNPELVLRSASPLSVQDIPDFDFVAQPPTDLLLPMLKPMSATYELMLAPMVSGVRIYALNNAKETHIEGMGHANILLEPRTPHAGDDLQITVHGIWYDGCVPAYQAHQRESHVITITTALPELVCGQVPTPWNFSVDVGRLVSDVYTVTVGGAVTATTTFTVVDQVAFQ